MDDVEANYERVLQEVQQQFGPNVIPVQYPLGAGEGFNRIVDALQRTVYHFPDEGGRPEKEDIPEKEQAKV